MGRSAIFVTVRCVISRPTLRTMSPFGHVTCPGGAEIANWSDTCVRNTKHTMSYVYIYIYIYIYIHIHIYMYVYM
jgi:hypothetical protein